MSFLKKETTPPVSAAPAGGPDVGSAADVEAVMKKYDRESNTRVWEGLPKLVIRWLMVAFSAYCIIDTVFLSTRQEVRLHTVSSIRCFCPFCRSGVCPFSWA